MLEKIKKSLNKVKKNEFWGKLFKNSFLAVVGEGGSSCINLLVVVLLIRLIDKEGYAILTLSQSYMLIMDTLINMQCWRGVIKYGEEAKTHKNIEEYKGYIKLGTIMDLTTAVICCIVSYFLVSLVGRILGWSDILILCGKIFSLEIIFHFSGTPTAVLRMENKFSWVSIQKICASSLKLVSILVILFINNKISTTAGVIIYTITDIVGHLILTIMSLIIIQKKYGIREIIKVKLPKKVKEFTNFTIWSTLSDIADIPITYFDVFIISKLSLSLVAIYKLFKHIIYILSKLTIPIYQAIYPQFSKLVSELKAKEGYRAVLKIRNVVLKFGIPSSIVIGITSYWWLNWIFDMTYARYWYVLTFYLVAHIVALSYTTIHPFFVSLGKMKEACLIYAFANVIYTIVAFILVGPLSMLGLILSYVIQYTIVIYLEKRMIEKSLKIKKEKEV